MRLLIFLLITTIALFVLVACFPSKPVVLSVSVAAQPTEVSEGATVLITVTAAPDIIDQITVSVDRRNLDSAFTNPATFVWTSSGVGEHTVEARVYSSIYGEGSDRTFVNVIDSTPPEIKSVSFMPAVPRPSEPFSVLVHAEDPESPYLDVVFRCGAVVRSQRFTAPPYVLEIDGVPEGLNDYEVTVINDTGKSAFIEGKLLVSPPDHTSPEVSVSIPDFIKEGENIRFSVTVEDNLSLNSVNISLDATTLESAIMGAGEKAWLGSYEWYSADSGAHFINIMAVDTHGNVTATTTSFIVSPASSARVSLSVDRTEALPGETVSFRTSIEGGIPSLVEFFVDDLLAQSSTSTIFRWTVEPGKHLITARAVVNGIDVHDGILYTAKDVVPPSVETKYQGVYLSSTEKTRIPVTPSAIVVVRANDVSGIEVDSPVEIKVLKYEMGTYVTLGTADLYLESLSADTQIATFVGILDYEISEEVVLRVTGVTDTLGNSLMVDYPVSP
ncbi:MAG: hypothetical protein PWP37_131 [Thermotogota bacterium]|nr:hypothetical protein [Thermotogota bacterium]MDK2863939.1 hypothetical protein [Thermotogota bacterium]HCZ05808.1 hypothetical protein [Thermotogota bacterium]